MAHLTNVTFKFFHEIFTEDASLRFLYHGAKKSKMTKNPNQGGSCLKTKLSTVQDYKTFVRFLLTVLICLFLRCEQFCVSQIHPFVLLSARIR